VCTYRGGEFHLEARVLFFEEIVDSRKFIVHATVAVNEDLENLRVAASLVITAQIATPRNERQKENNGHRDEYPQLST